jgi:glyoxylase-like metal-dependent hydrolase (beta-lactamase superfamily II)
MAEIIKINGDSWRIEDGGVRFFLLTGTKEALLIDSGMSVHNALDMAGELTGLPVELLNTHSDMDHIGSNGQFESFYMSPADEPAYRRQGGRGAVIPVGDGDRLDLGDRPLEIIGLPGHTPGSIAVLDVKGRVLISGDPIQDGDIFMFGPGRNMPEYIDSLERLEKKTGLFDELWPSHGSFPVKPKLIAQLIAGAKAVLAGEVPGEKAELFGHPVRRCSVGCAVFLCGI